LGRPHFDASRACEHVRRLADIGGRLAGTPGEKQAAQYILRQFRQLGLEAVLEPVRASKLPVFVMGRLAPLLGAALIVLAYQLLHARPMLSVAVYLVLLGGSGLLVRWPDLARRLLYKGRAIDSANVVARLRNDGQASRTGPTVVLMAHYDSKSQPVPVAFRIISFPVAVAIVLVLAVLAARTGFDPSAGVPSVAGPLTLLAVVLLGVQVANVPGNRSVGALDNASGVAVLLELAGALASRADVLPASITFVATGAEELGMAGAMAFADRHATELDPARTVFVNLDTVGAGGLTLLAGGNRPARKGRRYDRGGNCLLDKDLMLMAREAFTRQGLRVRLLNCLPAIGLDHMPVERAGLTALTVCQGVLPTMARIHSPWDVPEKVHASQLGKIGQAILALIERLAQ